MKLKNKVILITGATKGIGLALAVALAKKGAKVIASGRNSDILDTLEEQYPMLYTYFLDVTDDHSFPSVVANIKKEFGCLDVLINNAAILFSGDFGTHSYDNEQIDLEIMTNVSAPIKLTKAMLPILKHSDEGAVVNITSAVAHLPMKSLPIYSATKAAMRSFSISLRGSLHPSNLQVFEVQPPLVATAMTRDLPGEAKNMKMMSPEECAQKIIKGMIRDRKTIQIGSTAKSLYWGSKIFPDVVLKQLNKM